MHVVSTQLKGELRVALIDSGSHVSLVESSLITFNEKYWNLQMNGITGKQMEI
jgi:hypothetical protein